MKRPARVISDDASRGTLVELDLMTQCHRCNRGQGCGAGVFNASAGTAPIQILCARALSPGLTPRAGQRVLVDIDEGDSSWLWLVFGVYGLPLLGMLVATALATTFFDSRHFPFFQSSAAITPAVQEFTIILAAIAGLTGGFFAWRLLTPRLQGCAQRSLRLQSARIVAITPSSPRES